MTKEQVIDKITKLLALANDKPDENECKVALLMAQKFMMKYHISEDMLVTEKDRITSYMAFHPEMKGYRVDLAVILAPNYRCKTFIRNGYIFFMGEDSDAKICKAAFEFAYKNIKRDATRKEEEVRNIYGTAKGVHNSFALGYIKGIKSVLDEQSRALMVVVPQKVEDEFKVRVTGGDYNGGSKTNTVYREYYDEGFQKGRELFGKKKLKV